MLKKVLAWLLIISTTATIAIGGTLAYLTDRDSEANVFTVGDVDITLEEEFEQESQLKPGVDIEKNVQIKNEGPNEAYVWYTYAIPQGLEAGLDLTFDNTADWTNETASIGTKEVDGVTYNVYVCKYNAKLAAGETTSVGLTKVTMDPAVDITPEGDAYLVVEGETESLNWNINETEKPVIFVNAYAIQTNEFEKFEDAYNAFVGQWGNMVDAGTYEMTAAADTWDGTADTSWYNDTDTEFVITTAEQLAGLAELVDGGKTFAGKTVKVGRNIDLYAEDANGERISFEPIGSYKYRNDGQVFEGTFDGQGHRISNMYQNGWALENGIYDGDDLGLGLFGMVNDATIKNLVIDSADMPSEFNLIGSVAGAAYGDMVFENITVTNTYMGNHSYYSGGIVGWASGDHKYINCDVDSSTVISSQWGDFNNANGGIIGGIGVNGTYYMEDCDVACVIDAYNDVTSSYEWYSYRSCGMLIGNTGQKDDPDGDNVGPAIAPNLTCKNVTVTYGEWANYHYCEFGAMSFPWTRVEAGETTSAYGNARYSGPKDANGETVVDDNHAHNEGEAHNELIVFDQLYGGTSGDRYCTYGTATHDGVTVVYNNK